MWIGVLELGQVDVKKLVNSMGDHSWLGLKGLRLEKK
jgi:hypothetical protein